jgi:hypothetical protein
MEPHGTSWNLMEPHGTSWNLMEPHGTSWNLMEPHERFWNMTESSGCRKMMTSLNVSRTFQKPAVGL